MGGKGRRVLMITFEGIRSHMGKTDIVVCVDTILAPAVARSGSIFTRRSGHQPRVGLALDMPQMLRRRE